MPQIFKVWGIAVGLALVPAVPSCAWPEPVQARADGKRAFTVSVTGTGHRPMILIPGLLSSGEIWDGVVGHFASRYRLHVVTIAGFAGVPPVDGPLLPRVRDELVAYIRHNGLQRPVIVGHSLGAFVAFWAASTAPETVGPIVAVDGVPFLPALNDPSVTAAGMEPQAEGLRALYRSLSREQLETQTRMVLTRMITDPAKIAGAAAWAGRSDGRAAGQAIYELMTTDLRDDLARIESDVLLVAAGKAAASAPDRLEGLLKGYEAQVARVPRHRVIAAKQALHFVMLDDLRFLLSEMDGFLGASTPAVEGR